MVIRRACFGSSSGGGSLLLCKRRLVLEHIDGEKRVVLCLGSAVGATHSVANGKVLAVVAGEEEVVQGVVRGTVDDFFEWRVADHVRVVDQDAPEVDKDKEADGDDAVEREDKGKDVVRERLEVAI